MVRAIKIASCIAVIAAVAAYFSGAFQRPSHAMTAAEHVEHIKASRPQATSTPGTRSTSSRAAPHRPRRPT